MYTIFKFPEIIFGELNGFVVIFLLIIASSRNFLISTLLHYLPEVYR